MGRDAEAVAHDVGALLLVPTGMVVVSLPVAWLVGDQHAVLPLAGVAVVLGGVGGTLVHAFRHARAEHRWPAVEVVALGWLSTGLTAALVLVILGHSAPDGTSDAVFADPLNALFEGFSGITSTGMTILPGQEAELTRIAQWWRSLLQWVGGVGMVLFALGIGHPASGVRSLYEAEGRHPDLPGGVVGTVRRMAVIYLGFTAAAIAALAATGRDLWTALNHALTAISTGGFTISGDDLVTAPTGERLVMATIFIVGAIAFVAHHVLLAGRDPRAWWRLTPVRAQVTVLLAGSALFVAVAVLAGTAATGWDLVFQWASAASTAGFSTVADPAVLGAAPMVLLIAVMIVGAPSGSTGGGLKLDRAVWILKDLLRRARGGATVRWDAHPVPDGERRTVIRHSWILAGLWLLTLAAGVAAMSLGVGRSLETSILDVVSAQSNVGFQSAAVGEDLPATGKIVLTAVMYLGRLELLAALILATQTEHG